MKSIVQIMFALFVFGGCASSAPEPAAPEPSRVQYYATPNHFHIDPAQVSEARDDNERAVPCGGQSPPREYPPVCVTPYGAREVADIGEEDAHRSDWEGRPAHIFATPDRTVATLCRFREGACDKTGPKGDSACVDFTQCCTLGYPESPHTPNDVAPTPLQQFKE